MPDIHPPDGVPNEELREFARGVSFEDSPPPEQARKVCVALLSHDGRGECRTFLSIIQGLAALSAAGWQTMLTLREGDSMVARGRSVLASEFLLKPEMADCTDLLFIDTDLTFDGPALARILSHDVDVVAGGYPYKNDKGTFPVRWSSDGVFEHNGLWIMQGVTPGFLRIRRQALEKITVELPFLKFDNEGSPAWMFFDNLHRPNGVYDEGFIFCEHWRSVGGTVFIDPDIEIGHIGRKIYQPGTVRQWMMNAQAKIPEANTKYPHVHPTELLRHLMRVETIDLEERERDAVAKGSAAYAIDMSKIEPTAIQQ